MEVLTLEKICEAKSSNIAQKDLENNNGNYPIYGASGFIKNIDFYRFEKPYLAVVKDGAGVGRVMLLPGKSSVIGTMQALLPKDNVDIDYLYYYLKSKKLARYYTGATIPHIYFKDYKNEKCNIYDLQEQKRISRELKLIANMIDFKNKQIENLNQLIKSQFVEMFGNDNYEKELLKNNVEEMFIGPFGSALKNECFIEKYNGYCVVYEQKHAINKNIEDFRWVNESKYNELKRFNVIPGDIIVSCRGTIGKTFVIPDNAPIGIMHPSIMKIRLKKEKYIPRFFEMVLENYLFENEKQTNGATIKMGIRASVLENEKFIIPDMNTQIKFLHIVEQIDKQKFEFEKSLKKLEELQASLMQEYFG